MYNPLVSYEENLHRGPAAGWNRGGYFPRIRFTEAARFALFDIPLHLPLGIAAGPLLSSDFVGVSLAAGFCMPVYKTVRSLEWSSHPWPNVLRLAQIRSMPEGGDASAQHQLWTSHPDAHFQMPCVEVLPLEASDIAAAEKAHRLTITNAFGVPSRSPADWSRDFARLPQSAFCDGRMAVLSFQGSRLSGAPWVDFLADTAHTARLAAECVAGRGGRLIEMNVSCPNEAGAPVYTDVGALTETLRAAAEALVDFPQLRLIVKLGVVPDDKVLAVVEAVARYAHGLSAINTVSAKIVTPDGARALGSGAEHGGVCGFAIREQAIAMVTKFNSARRALGLNPREFALIGVGGCMTPSDLESFIAAGADVVHAATGAMWNLQFAGECARKLNVNYQNEDDGKNE